MLQRDISETWLILGLLCLINGLAVPAEEICRRGDGRIGTCLPINECFKRGGETEPAGSIILCRDQIKRFGEIIVCCRSTPATIAKQKCEEWSSTCRIPNQLVVNGRDAKLGEFPYMVSIQEKDQHKCGGVLISPQFILTAAHCIKETRKNRYRLLLGAYNLKTGHPSFQRTSILQVISYPYFNDPLRYNDIILLRIERVRLTDNVRPVCLPYDDQATWGGPLLVTGWGQTEAFGDFSDTLKKGFLKFKDKLDCVITHGKVPTKYPFGVSRDVICAHEEFTDACRGDSGGPLLSPGSSTCYNRLLGLVSVGESCPSAKPSQYTKVSLFLRWIVDEAFVPSGFNPI